MEKIYPSWRYHAEYPPCLVCDEKQESALGPHWYESPAEIKVIPAVVEECNVVCPKLEVKKTIKRGASKS